MKPTRILCGTALCGTLFLATTALAAREVEDNISKSFETKSGGKLVVDADRGSIEVKTAGVNRIEIQILRKVSRESEAKAREILDNHEISFSRDGETVRVHAEFKKDWTSAWRDKGRNLQVRYLINVPSEFNVDLKTAGGGIKVADLSGEARARTAGGSLNFGRIEGPIYGRTSGGGVSVTGCKGNVDVETAGGSVSLGEVEGNTTARTSGGSINVKKANGTTVVSTSGGGIEVNDAKGSVNASTSGGSIAATLSDQPSGDCRLRTSGGSIKVNLGEKVAIDLDAKTSGGRVTTELAVASVVVGEHKSNALQGKINGGGPTLSLQTSGGSIYVRKK